MGSSDQIVNRTPITKEEIIKVSLDIIQREGLKKFSVRRLAEELNIKGASLYWHFKNKNELMELLADEYCKKIELPDKQLSWEDQLVQLAHHLRKVFLAHRDSAIIMSETAPHTPYRKQVIAHIADIFISAGFRKEDLFSALWLFNTYVTSFVMEEYRLKNLKTENQNRDSITTSDDSQVQLIIPDMDREFAFGLEVILNGFKVELQKKYGR